MNLPAEVRGIIESETSTFKNYTTQYILNNYELGPSDMILRFVGGEIQVLKKNRQRPKVAGSAKSTFGFDDEGL